MNQFLENQRNQRIEKYLAGRRKIIFAYGVPGNAKRRALHTPVAWVVKNPKEPYRKETQ